MLIGRGLLVAAAALLLAVQVVRDAAVAALAPLRPDQAARFWQGHPAVEISGALAAIGGAAHDRRAVDPGAFREIDDAAAKSPLSPEPFLVSGVEAQTHGHGARAERAFGAAQWRDPRSLAAAYFLADHYFRSGRPLQGLAETAVLARLAPNGTAAVAPYVAAYAQDRSNWGEIRQLFKSQDGMENAVLTALAHNGRNADTILALASPAGKRADSAWLPILLNSLIADRNYARARDIWSRVGAPQASEGSLVYDAGFAAPGAPPPFNWTLTTSNVGLAERQPGGRLHALFYGNVDGVLAKQLVVLTPGTYRLAMNIVGSPAHAETLSWDVRCDRSAEPLANAAVADIAKAGWTFTVPANCPAQWLELSGRSADVAQQADVTIGGLTLTRAGGNV